jgi:hypothetical protein
MNEPNSAIMRSIEELNYRVTVGDVATKSGLDLKIVQPGLIQLAADTNGNLQVAETGDIAYVFPKNFRSTLQNKYWKLRWQKFLERAWQVIFYLIRISFGVILITSIIIMLLAIVVIIIAISSSRGDDNNNSSSSRGGGNFFFFPNFWFTPDLFWIFSPGYQERRYRNNLSRRRDKENELNFLESIYSFLFGDGHPNPNLEERRWQNIGAVIKNNHGAIIAEQVAPYLDNITMYNERDEDYVLPVLTRFNGYPEVSEQGEIVYYFPELQVTAENNKRTNIAPYLQEKPWQFSLATSGQKITAIFLGGFNFILALMLGSLLNAPEVAQQMGDFIAFVDSIYGLLIAYAIGYLVIPLIRYFWLQRRNRKLEQRNEQRQQRANILSNNPQLQAKINYAQQFADQKVITGDNVVYSTEKDLLEQADDLLNDWDKRLSDSSN